MIDPVAQPGPRHVVSICPIYDGDIADPFGRYGYVVNTHSVYVLDTSVLINYDYYSQEKPFSFMWKSVMRGVSLTHERAGEFRANYVRLIQLGATPVVPHLNSKIHEILVLQRVPDRIFNSDVGFVIPSRFAGRNEQGTVARSWQELLNAE